MLGYLVNLLPRLRQFSQSLEQSELFVDKPWVMLDDDGQRQTYIFRRGGELLMSLDGVVQMGSWEYIAPAESILIDRKVDKLLLNHFFFTEALLVLARDGRPDSKFILANRQLIPDLDVAGYLRTFEARQLLQPDSRSQTTIKVPLHIKALITTGGLTLEAHGLKEQLAAGDAVYIGSEVAPDGQHTIIDSVNSDTYGLEVKDGLVRRIFWPRNFKLTTGETMVVECSAKEFAPAIGNRIYSTMRDAFPDGKHTIAGFGRVRVRSGIIEALPWL